MSNKLRSFLIVVMSIIVVMAALPFNALTVRADDYSLTYHVNGGGASVEDVTCQISEGATSTIVLDINDSALEFTAPVGMVFACWAEHADGSGVTYLPGDNIDIINSNMDLYAIWGYTVTYKANGLSQQADIIDTVAKGVDYYYYQDCEKFTVPEDKVLLGWEDENHNTYLETGTIPSIDKNYTFSAQWANARKITFDKNTPNEATVSGDMLPQIVPQGVATAITENKFTCAGYCFMGWKADNSTTGTEYADKADITAGDADITLYAQWAAAWEITYDSNNGSGKKFVDKYLKSNGDYTLLKPEDLSFEYEGYKFTGWYSTASSSGTLYSDTLSADKMGDLPIFAHWEFDADNYYKVTYYPNGESSTGCEQVVEKTSTTFNLADQVADGKMKAPDGKRLASWNTAADGTGTKYDVTEELATQTADGLVLYAQWEDIPYTIKFMSEDGSTEIGTVTCTYGNTPSFTGPNPTKEKTDNNVFVFDGWSKETNSTGSVLSTLPEVKADAIYYAHFKSYLRYYSVTASVSDSEGGSVSGSGNYEWESNAIVTVTLTTGYQVKKWTVDGTDVASTATTYTIENVKDSHDVQVVLEKVPHTITVNATEGGQATVQDNLVYGDTANAVAAANTGYSFVNWTENGTEVSTDSTYTFTVTSDRTLTANFIINSYDISLSSDGNGTVEGEGKYNHFSTPTVIATPNTGYHFVNWTDENGTEVSTSASYSFEVDGARNLTANFEINSYSVEATDGEHGSVSGSGTFKHSETCTLVAIPDKGYHFVGWEENGTVVSENANYRFPVTSDRSLEAVFEINMYTVTYKNDDGTILQEGEMPWGSTASYQHMANPTKKPTAQFTYTFAGWDNKDTLVTKDITYTATYTYTVNKYKITFANEDGTVLQTGEIEYGKFPVYEKDTPTKASTVQETFTFAGWDKEISKVTGETVYTATYTSKPITKDSINYKYFTVAFVTNGGSEIVSQLVAEGGVAFKPEEPLRERYTFGGWYIDEALTKPFSFATAITSDITLYAKWIKGSPDIEATYAVVGLGSTSFELGSGEDITVAVERSKDNDSIATHFKGVLIDGVDVDYYNYELTEDNSAVIIRSDAFEGLEAGNHTITIVYDDGTAEVELVVTDANEPTAAVEKITETEAGDTEPVNFTAEKSSNWGLWIALGIVAVVVIAAIPIFIIKGRSLK